MPNFNINNSDFYYTGATGSFNNFCYNTFAKPTSYLYVPGHDDEYIDNNGIWSSLPWPHLNTGLLEIRPPTPIFSGSGECIGCPKVASNIEYINQRQFSDSRLSNEWENIYPTGQNFPFLETGLKVSWFQPQVDLTERVLTNFDIQWWRYYGPVLKIVEPTAEVTNNGNYVNPYWETHGAKIHIKYSIRGNNYVRLVVGFVAKIVDNYSTEYDMFYDTDITSIDVDNYVNGYLYSLYYKYPDLGTDFNFNSSPEQPIFIFDSCAVKNVDNELNAYGPAPGFHPHGIYQSIYIKYFAFTKKEGIDPYDQFQKVEANISVAGFGWPNGLAGLYSSLKPDNIPVEKVQNIFGTTVDNFRSYKLNWGRGINIVTGLIVSVADTGTLNQGICLYRPYNNLGVATERAYIDTENNLYISNKNPFSDINPCYGRKDGYTTCEAYGYLINDVLRAYVDIPPPPFMDYVSGTNKPLHRNADFKGLPIYLKQTGVPIFPPPPIEELTWVRAEANPYEGNLLQLSNYGYIPNFTQLFQQELAIKNDDLVDYIENLEIEKNKISSSLPKVLNTKNDLISTSEALPGFYGGSHAHPLFYIGGKQIFATEPLYRHVWVELIRNEYYPYGGDAYFKTSDPTGAFIHPYRKMMEFLDNFGIKTNFEIFNTNNCAPQYIVTTPVSNPITFYSGCITKNYYNYSTILSVTRDNIIDIKSLGNVELNMYNIGNANQVINLGIISDTGLFLEDIEYIYPANPTNLQGSPSKIVCNNNIVYNLAPFFGYYKYDLSNGCVTYDTSFNTNYPSNGDGGYSDLIVNNNKIYLLNEFKNNIYVINKFNNILVSTISGFQTPKAMALDETNNKLYVSSLNDFTIKIFNDNYKLTGTINLLTNEYASRIQIFNNKLYTLTNVGLLIISGINQVTGRYDAYSNTTGYKRIAGIRGYDILKIPENNNIYIGTDSEIKILDSNTDTFSQISITGFDSNVVVPTFLNNYFIRADSMAYNENNKKIYSIDKSKPYVFISNTGTKKCEKIIDLGYPVGWSDTITFDSSSNKMYISTSDRVFNRGLSNNFVILGDRPKAQVSFPSAPQLLNGNTYSLNVTSNNSETSIIYKSKYPINDSGHIILPTGAVLNNSNFTIFAGQKATTGFAYSFAMQNCKIGTTGNISVLYYDNQIIYPPQPLPTFLQYSGSTHGAVNCDFDNNYKIITLGHQSDFTTSTGSLVKIYNFNNTSNILQTFTGYGSRVQINGSGSLITITNPSQQFTGSSLISIFTGTPGSGNYKFKQTITGLTGYSTNKIYFLNRSGDIFIEKIYNSGVIYTGSLNSDWKICNYISGNNIQCFKPSMDGSIIIGNKTGEKEIVVFTGSKYDGWKFKGLLPTTGIELGNNFYFGCIKNEDIILIKHNTLYTDSNQSVHVFTGSKNNGWKFKQRISTEEIIDNFDISDDGKVIFVKNNPMSISGSRLLSFTGSKNDGWKLSDIGFYSANNGLISHGNYLANYSYDSTNFYTYNLP